MEPWPSFFAACESRPPGRFSSTRNVRFVLRNEINGRHRRTSSDVPSTPATRGVSDRNNTTRVKIKPKPKLRFASSRGRGVGGVGGGMSNLPPFIAPPPQKNRRVLILLPLFFCFVCFCFRGGGVLGYAIRKCGEKAISISASSSPPPFGLGSALREMP